MKEKFDIYEAITNRFIAALENGKIPWKKPWTGGSDYAFNRITKKKYSLLNQLMLIHSGEYASFKQWQELGGTVKKGEKGEMVVFWKPIIEEVEDEETGLKHEKVSRFILRYYTVFHISQVDGVEPLEQPKENLDIKPIECAEELKEAYIEGSGIDFKEIFSSRAFYSPSQDSVTVPEKGQFNCIEEYYSTLFHEFVHSTGHSSRLKRTGIIEHSGFGSEKYSKEELIAEIGSAAICYQLGIESENSFENSSAYIQSWLSCLKEDKKLIVSASGQAEKAIDYIFGYIKEEENAA